MSEAKKLIDYANWLIFDGKPIEAVPEAWRDTVIAYLGRWIWDKAQHVLRGRTQEDRRQRLAEINPTMRPYVESEARRQYELRKR